MRVCVYVSGSHLGIVSVAGHHWMCGKGILPWTDMTPVLSLDNLTESLLLQGRKAPGLMSSF